MEDGSRGAVPPKPAAPLLHKERPSLPPVQHAALYIEDAVQGVRRLHPRPGSGPRQAFVVSLEVLPLVQLSAIAGVILTFFERPAWCNMPEMQRAVKDPCENPMYPSYPMDYLTLRWNFIIELCLFLPLLGHSLLSWYSQGSAFWQLPAKGPFARSRSFPQAAQGKTMQDATRASGDRCVAMEGEELLGPHALKRLQESAARWRQLSRCCCVILYICDLIYGYSTPVYYFRLAPYLRICFVVLYSSATRDRLRMVFRTFPDVISILVLIWCYLIVFAWLGVLCFPAGTAENVTYFSNLRVGVWNLYVLLTTANYPDVMMPVYIQDRLAILFFVVFIMIGVFFLMNLLTAAVFHTYKGQVKENRTRLKENADANFKQAFRLLSDGAQENGEDVITRQIMRELFEELNHYKDINYVTPDAADWHFQRLDLDGSSSLSWSEFKELGAELTAIRVRRVRPPMLERRCPRVTASATWQRLRQIVHDPYFDVAIDTALALNVALTVAETWGAITGRADTQEDLEGERRWHLAELAMTSFYVIETTLKILVDGFDGYWRSFQNRFDFLITVATSMVAFVIYMPNSYDDHRWIHYVSMVRLLRVMRLLLHIPSFQYIFVTFVEMLPDAVAVLKVLFCFMYTFDVVGVQLFGGVINSDPTSPYASRVTASDFGKTKYYANNFNDMPSGLATLFELLVVNNWFVLAGGFAAAVGDWALIYFVIFHVVCVCVCLNIVVAFIIDTFMEVYAGVEDRQDLPSVET